MWPYRRKNFSRSRSRTLWVKPPTKTRVLILRPQINEINLKKVNLLWKKLLFVRKVTQIRSHQHKFAQNGVSPPNIRSVYDPPRSVYTSKQRCQMSEFE